MTTKQIDWIEVEVLLGKLMGDIRWQCARYTKHIKIAFEVVDKLIKDSPNKRLEFVLGYDVVVFPQGWVAGFGSVTPVDADTPERAICLAALMYKEIDIPYMEEEKK